MFLFFKFMKTGPLGIAFRFNVKFIITFHKKDD